MGAAKSVIERLCRYFAVALARRKITVNAFSSGWTGEQSPWSAGDSISPGPQDAYQQFGPYRGGNSAELQKQAGPGEASFRFPSLRNKFFQRDLTTS